MYIDISMHQTDARKMYEKGYKLYLIKKEISYSKRTGELSVSDEVNTYRVYLPDVNWSLNKMLKYNLSDDWGRKIVIPLDGDSTAQTIYVP